ncbi:VanZ family protein [Nocardioides sp. AE5]|uniref:VanZ family protein n=1 Tax=Nocardioides sp. AE5 TaxID=2962573 RepID=UPI0028828777|nr:VanZ family protein [Nocardioides sp. AE5]MDT0202379.1 VanZ family protein [Nocardioides sp. AE5]
MRRFLLAAFAVYVAVAAYLVFWPQPDTPGGAVASVSDLFAWLGLDGFGPVQVEIALNVLLFVPLTVLGAVLWPQVRAWQWVVIAMVATLAIESTQYVALPGRSATVSDLIANTSGAILGLAPGIWLRAWLSRRSWWPAPDGAASTARAGR